MAMNTTHHWTGVLDSAADAVGHTPLINLRRLAQSQGIRCNILAKVEFFSAGGSIKDRIAKRMIETAEREGLLHSGSVIIEPTSGNTGIGLALMAGLKGYRCIITLPSKMSKEKEAVLRSLGAEVVRTPTEAGWEDEDSHIQIAQKLAKEIPGGIILDQYNNIQNPLAHYYNTFGEIQHALRTSSLPSDQIHALVAGAGTGGTITGLSRALRDAFSGRYPLPEKEAAREVRKEVREYEDERREVKLKMNHEADVDEDGGGMSGSEGEVVEISVGVTSDGHAEANASTKERRAEEVLRAKVERGEGIVVGVDPVGSILGGGQVGQYVIEGIGYDFFPEVLDPSDRCIDRWIKTSDEEAYHMVRTVMQTESLLIGGSSGSALAGLFKFLKETPVGRELAQREGKNVVVVLPDGIRNYISKDWFLDPVLKGPVSNLGQSIEKVLGRKMGEAYPQTGP